MARQQGKRATVPRAPIEAILSRLLEDHRHPVVDFAY
jgi:hypothetical protein